MLGTCILKLGITNHSTGTSVTAALRISLQPTSTKTTAYLTSEPVILGSAKKWPKKGTATSLTLTYVG